MPGFFVRLNEDSFRALVGLAVDERRDVRDQAAVLLERTLQPVTRPLRASVSEVPRLQDDLNHQTTSQPVPA